jgi:hypothetical protein
MTAEALPEIYPATEELIAFALASRHDWTEREVRDALTTAAHCGVTRDQAITGLPRLIVDRQAKPADLVPDSRSPLVRRPGAEPSETYQQIRAGLRRPA